MIGDLSHLGVRGSIFRQRAPLLMDHSVLCCWRTEKLAVSFVPHLL